MGSCGTRSESIYVMLTRFRKGTIICTSRNFVKNQAADSLVGELATYLGDETWVGQNGAYCSLSMGKLDV